MRHKIQRYVLPALAIMMAIAMVGQLLSRSQQQDTRTVHLSVILPAEQPKNDSRLMDGVRDCAMDYSIVIHTIYSDSMQTAQLQDLLDTEAQIGSEGTFAVYPELYLRTDAQSDGVIHTGDHTVLALTDTLRDAFSYHAEYRAQTGAVTAENRFTDMDQIRQVLAGEREQLYVPNEYQMGYYCIRALYQHAMGNAMADVSADYVVLTKQRIESGSYDALLSE